MTNTGALTRVWATTNMLAVSAAAGGCCCRWCHPPQQKSAATQDARLPPADPVVLFGRQPTGPSDPGSVKVFREMKGLKAGTFRAVSEANFQQRTYVDEGYDADVTPTVGASLQIFHKGQTQLPPNVDVHELSRAAAPAPGVPLPPPQQAGFKQSVGIFDSANGSVRDRLTVYAQGRHDPLGSLGTREYLLNMDRYCGFVYHELILDLLRSMNS